MQRRNFLTAASAGALASCARMEQRRPRYDTKECPFCVPDPGVCFYCSGSGKCSFCGGSGTRTTTTPPIPDQGISEASYEEECPYCKGSGTCRYCDGVGKCWACKGSGRIEEWNFYEKHKKSAESGQPEVAEPRPKETPGDTTGDNVPDKQPSDKQRSDKQPDGDTTSPEGTSGQ